MGVIFSGSGLGLPFFTPLYPCHPGGSSVVEGLRFPPSSSSLLPGLDGNLPSVLDVWEKEE